MLDTLLSFCRDCPGLTVLFLIAFLWTLNLLRLTIRPPAHCSCQAPVEDDEEE